MNERLICICVSDGEVGVTLGALFHYFYAPCDLTIVEVQGAPSVDDAGLTLDINDDGTAVVAAMSMADQNVPGRWRSKHVGGAEDPVTIAAGSLVSLDMNAAAANTRVLIYIWALTGEKWA